MYDNCIDLEKKHLTLNFEMLFSIYFLNLLYYLTDHRWKVLQKNQNEIKCISVPNLAVIQLKLKMSPIRQFNRVILNSLLLAPALISQGHFVIS